MAKHNAAARYDEDRVDECTFALMYLVASEVKPGAGSRALKGLDWDTLKRLYAKGLISDPETKSSTVTMSAEAYAMCKDSFARLFGK